jgi:ATP-dependent Lon protease
MTSNNKKKKAAKKTGADTVELSFDELPVLFSLDLVAFPGVVMSLYVENEASQKAVDTAIEQDGQIIVLAFAGDPGDMTNLDSLYRVGVLAKISKKLTLNDGRYKVLLQGNERVSIERFDERESVVVATAELLMSDPLAEFGEEELAIIERINANLHVLVEYEHLPEEMLLVIEEIEDPGQLADVLIAHYKLEIQDAQNMLEEVSPIKRLHFADKVIANDLSQLSVSENIMERTREELSKGQREYFLKEQLKQIQRELGDNEDKNDELASLKKSIADKKLPEHARKEADRQLSRLDRMHVETSEYAMLRTYLEWIADLPWGKCTRDRLSLDVAQKILDDDHYGLEKAKERIIEFLSVRKLKRDSHGPILCFVGPPGVGKTSLGKSIANCLNRKFIRISLGGMRDEAEIRGHRRTYVGALPGRIIQGLKEAGSSNPVFLFDELDKIGADFRGDPAAALLEILDPEQNKGFRDHYLNINYDLSRSLFIATANTTDTIPDALLDRLEVIRISGYTAQEKLDIAQRYIVPRQLKEQGLDKLKIKFVNDALLFLVERYTREAGVRNLERQVASVCRKVARLYVQTDKLKKRITTDLVREFLGATRYDPEVDERESIIGLCRGLAWTVHGGEVMPVEASIAKGKGALTLTGHLGDVMQESAQAAVFYARSNAERLGLDPDFYKNVDIHIHVPSAATPKDGPSAGITIVTALVSVLSDRPVSKDIAMTGEITLRGAVLPIGGLKEKALAALRYGISKVIIPFENVKDLEEVPEEQRKQLEFIPVRHVSEVLERALLKPAGKKIAPSKGKKKGKRLKGKLIVES